MLFVFWLFAGGLGVGSGVGVGVGDGAGFSLTVTVTVLFPGLYASPVVESDISLGVTVIVALPTAFPVIVNVILLFVKENLIPNQY